MATRSKKVSEGLESIEEKINAMVAEKMEAMEERFMGLLSKVIETKTVEVAKEKGLAKDHTTLKFILGFR